MASDIGLPTISLPFAVQKPRLSSLLNAIQEWKADKLETGLYLDIAHTMLTGKMV